jgi:hypothetical protein
VSPSRLLTQYRNCGACGCNDGEVNQDEESSVSRDHGVAWIKYDLSAGECGGSVCSPCPNCFNGLWDGDEQGNRALNGVRVGA